MFKKYALSWMAALVLAAGSGAALAQSQTCPNPNCPNPNCTGQCPNGDQQRKRDGSCQKGQGENCPRNGQGQGQGQGPRR
jgi:hypothetical protein